MAIEQVNGTMEGPYRKIIHIDMDAFYASVEQRDNPELRGKPVAVGGNRERGVVAAASYEARKFGVFSAMASVVAARKCPELIFVRPRFEAYKIVSNQIRAIFAEYTDLIEPLSLDEAYLDVTVNKKAIEVATDIAKEIKIKIKEQTLLTASAGVSYNKFLAKVASDVNKPDGLFVIKPHQAQSFIDSLAVKKFFGIGKVTAGKLEAMGVRNGKDLKALSEEKLYNLFGKSGLYYYQIVRGQDHRKVSPNRETKSIGAENTFEKDLTQLEEMITALEKIAEEVVRRLEKNRLSGKTITLKIKFHNFEQITRSKTLMQTTRELPLILRTIRDLLEAVYTQDFEVRLLGITLSNFEDDEDFEGKQLRLGLES